MTQTSVNKSCPYFPQLGPVGCLLAPNIFLLAKETFAKGKMFWNHVFRALSHVSRPSGNARRPLSLPSGLSTCGRALNK